MKIYIDGKFYDEKNAKISVFDHGLLYGLAQFLPQHPAHRVGSTARRVGNNDPDDAIRVGGDAACGVMGQHACGGQAEHGRLCG